MSAFALDPQQRRWCATLRTVAADRLRPLAERGAPGRVNRPLVAALGELGLLRRLFPTATDEPGAGPGADPEGGAAGAGAEADAEARTGARARGGADDGPSAARALDLCLLRESLATQCAEAETALALQALGCYPVVQSGTAEQRARWLPEVIAGRAVAAYALSEPGAGSDAAALTLAARPVGPARPAGATDPGAATGTATGAGSWELTGEKCWISNAPEADFYTVFARTTPGAGSRGITAFLVPADRPGLGGEPLEMLSPHPIGRLTFDAVPVTRADVLGEVDAGFKVAMRTLNLLRPSVGAFAVGMAQHALDLALAHARQRTAFGGPLRDLQAVSHQLAEMATRTEAARLLVYAAASAYDTGQPDIARRSAMAKLLATETAQYVVDAAVQIHGARALERGHPLEHLYREVRAPRIYEGATEVQRTIIAKELYR
ncbi:acyl-CoA dehydrogenase family protein [Streptomyces sp. 71268]|uniref:acyl-CoA dehydrogenase family protein n=1 Tax=Streptomyces sp. 71268 TaxID=3002640 RepID=UPI0023F74E9E|nr:acyl-CoA dehydrogenase family protein [Streptomyces sp. 71268]WEV24881.1 acyl-CoA dehydrogenase family protein [Streptomyces sp. 71268]